MAPRKTERKENEMNRKNDREEEARKKEENFNNKNENKKIDYMKKSYMKNEENMLKFETTIQKKVI